MSRGIERRHVVASVGLLGLLLLTLAYLYGNILGGSLTQRPLQVTVELEQTGGLFEGSNVTYRGVSAGTVDVIRSDGTRVTATISLDPSARVPADTVARVRSLSPAGEQYLDFQPRRDQSPWLEDGDRIAVGRTSTPTSVATALGAVDDLMSQIDRDDLATVLDELHAAFADPDDLGDVLTAGDGIVRTLDEKWPQTERVLVNGRTVLSTGVDRTDQFTQLTGSLTSLTASLEDYDPELRTILERTPDRVDELRSFTAMLTEALPDALRGADRLTAVVATRDQHLRALLETFPRGLGRLADTIEGGRLRGNLLVSPGEVCSYGVTQASPRSSERRPVVAGRRCAADFGGQQRGSAHVPAAGR